MNSAPSATSAAAPTAFPRSGNSSSPAPTPVSRRGFLRSSTALAASGAALAFAHSPTVRAAANKNSRLQIFQIGTGQIGGMQRRGLNDHPKVKFVGFCDVDQTAFNQLGDNYPDAWRIADYREAFADRLDQFDAVIVDTPDHHHCPMMVTALAKGKHVYGQKPLVHQLAELKTIREAAAARPELYTQMGNQRACTTGRMQAVELLRTHQLGRPVEAWIWTGGMSHGTYFVDPWAELPQAEEIPETMNWDLWHGPLTGTLPYSEDIHPRRWRSYWDTGGGMLADWGCHLFDVLYFAYDLGPVEAVQTTTIKPAGVVHSGYNQSVLTYPGGGDTFAREKFVVHYNDDNIKPSFASLGMPQPEMGGSVTMVVCEEGVLLLAPGGEMEIYRKGKRVENEALAEVEPRNHWHDWADCCLGKEKPLWTPFDIGTRITEGPLLAAKATRYPGVELRWDSESARFTNHDEANETIVSREYREGFAPPAVG